MDLVKDDKIVVITCGWTIDKYYWLGKGVRDLEIWNPIIWELLKKVRATFSVEIIEILRKDSLDMNDKDRKKIVETIENLWDDKKNILITHWTDTMVKTWIFIKEKINELKKTIVLVWASRPYLMKETDADFNVWFALGVLKVLSNYWKYWVYVAMNWNFFDIDFVEKWNDGVFRKKSKNPLKKRTK